MIQLFVLITSLLTWSAQVEEVSCGATQINIGAKNITKPKGFLDLLPDLKVRSRWLKLDYCNTTNNRPFVLNKLELDPDPILMIEGKQAKITVNITLKEKIYNDTVIAIKVNKKILFFGIKIGCHKLGDYKFGSCHYKVKDLLPMVTYNNAGNRQISGLQWSDTKSEAVKVDPENLDRSETSLETLLRSLDEDQIVKPGDLDYLNTSETKVESLFDSTSYSQSRAYGNEINNGIISVNDQNNFLNFFWKIIHWFLQNLIKLPAGGGDNQVLPGKQFSGTIQLTVPKIPVLVALWAGGGYEAEIEIFRPDGSRMTCLEGRFAMRRWDWLQPVYNYT